MISACSFELATTTACALGVRSRCQAAKAPIRRLLPFLRGRVISFSRSGPEQCEGDALLERFQVESDLIAQIDEVSVLLAAFGHVSAPPQRAYSALQGGLGDCACPARHSPVFCARYIKNPTHAVR